MANPPFVSIVIPCRNEENYIGRCLDSIVSQDYPKEKMEVLLVDGASEDKTREIAEQYSKRFSFIKILPNPRKFTPFGLNLGIKAARGEVVARMDAHADYDEEYISKCVKYLKKYGADNVGGAIQTLPEKNTLISRAIALSLSHFFGAGGSDFRLGAKEPRWVDTVFGGCFRKEIFDKIGLFNEKLIRSQDLEFNLRLKKAGGKILLAPDIICHYYPKSNFSDFFFHNFRDGIWSVYPLKFGLKFSLRHFIPLIFVSGLIFLLVFSLFSEAFFHLLLSVVFFYFLASFFFSLEIALKNRETGLFFVLPLAFAVRHFGYGLGSFGGLLKILKD